MLNAIYRFQAHKILRKLLCMHTQRVKIALETCGIFSIENNQNEKLFKERKFKEH